MSYQCADYSEDNVYRVWARKISLNKLRIVETDIRGATMKMYEIVVTASIDESKFNDGKLHELNFTQTQITRRIELIDRILSDI